MNSLDGASFLVREISPRSRAVPCCGDQLHECTPVVWLPSDEDSPGDLARREVLIVTSTQQSFDVCLDTIWIKVCRVVTKVNCTERARDEVRVCRAEVERIGLNAVKVINLAL